MNRPSPHINRPSLHIPFLRAACLWALVASASLAAVGMVASATPAPTPSTPLRIGVTHLPAKADVPAARVYTEDSFDLDLAAEIGRRLGRPVVLVDTGHEEAPDTLIGGRVDALVLRLPEGTTDLPALDVLPAGYSSSLTVAMRTDTSVRRWEDLAGRTVCVAQANQQAQLLARSLGATVVVQPVPALSLMRVRTGECDAALHDETTLTALFADPEWKKFSATLPPRDATELAVVLPRTGGPEAEALRAAIPTGDHPFWEARVAQWARDVALEVYLDQDAPDCH